MLWQGKLIKVKKKNNIDTKSYFVKRLRDCGYDVVNLYDGYLEVDPRKWTILIDPKGVNLLITCYKNRGEHNDHQYEFNDGGNLFPMNFVIQTVSMEVIITNLVERHVPLVDKDKPRKINGLA